MSSGGIRDPWPEELNEWLRVNVVGRRMDEIIKLQHEAFPDRPLEAKQIQNFRKRNHLRSGVKPGVPTGTPSKKFPQPVVDYIRVHHDGVGAAEMARQLNERFGAVYTASQIIAYYKNHHFRSGNDTRFKVGHTPANKGKHVTVTDGMRRTMFKPGSVPHTKEPIGTRVERMGYIWQKIGPGKRDWRQLHRIVWEEANGPVPEGMVLIFLDGDHHHIELSNLKLVSKSVHQILNVKKWRRADPELTETYATIAELKTIINRRTKNEQRKQE